MDIELLISIVKTYPVLYNKQEKGYKDTLRKENIWKQIAETLQCTVEECQTQFKSLREKYLRERKAYEIRCRSGAGLEDVPSWEWYQEMDYLDTYIQRRKTCSNIKRKHEDKFGECSKSKKTENVSLISNDSLSLDSDSENLQYTVSSPITEVITDHDYENTELADAESDPPSQIKNNKKTIDTRNSKKQENGIATNADEEIINTMRYLRDMSNVNDSDEDGVFCTMLACELRKIEDAEKKRLVKVQLFNTLFFDNR